MSLFSGIKFSAAAAETASSSTPATRPAAAAPSRRAPSPTKAEPPLNDAPAAATASSSTPAWSTASLSLAPRRPKPKPGPSNRTTYVPPAPTSAPDAHSSADIIRAASPKLIDRDQLGPDGAKLGKAPSMTLAPSVKKPKVRRDRKGRKIKEKPAKQERGQGQSAKALKRKAKRRAETVFHAFDPDEPYDPNRPNDLTEYQAYRKREREERRQRLIESKKRKLAGGRSSDESDSSDYSSDDGVRRDAPKMFAPPKYDSPPPQPTRAAPPAPAPAPVLTQAASGVDAYARRLAMSTGATRDDAYARRMALSQQRAPEPPQASFVPPPPPPVTPAPPPPPQHSYVPPPPQNLYTAPPPPAQNVYAPRPPPPQAAYAPPLPPQAMPPFAPNAPSAMPPFAPTGAQAMPPFAPRQAFAPSQPQPTAAAPVPASFVPTVTKEEDPEAYQKLVEKKMAAAAAVAARLASMGANRPPAPAPVPDDPNATFAEKMMRRWGHEEGKGLGTDGSGIVHALSAEHANQPKPGKRNKFKPGKWVQAPNAMGKIVNLNADERAKAEREAKGESSRIVCLLGVVEGPEYVDAELADEIGEECNKIGVVERVVLHMVSPPPPEPWKCLRTFVVFSGPAGAWRAIKELDGRFFGGRQLEVTYFDEGRFMRGDRDGPLLTTSSS